MKKNTAPRTISLRRQIIIGCIILAVAAAIGLVWQVSPLADDVTPEKVAEKIQKFKDNPWAPLMMIGIFVAGGICFFPLTALTVATALTFGPLQGIFIALTGAISSAMLVYGIGYFLGIHRVRKWIGPLCDYLQARIGKSVLEMAALRLVLITPYTMGNLALGIIGVRFRIFVAGTFLALIPGAVIRSILGDALMDFLRHPDSRNMAYIIAGILGWIAIVVSSQILSRKWHH